MRAVRFDRHGDYGELKLVTLERPEPSPGELLIRIVVAAVNPVDSTVRAGRFNGAKPPPMIPGQEAAGVVAGGGTRDCPDGTRVLIRGGFGTVRDGTWAELVVARPEQVLLAPEGLDDAAVAASGSGFLAAALALDRASFVTGKSVLALGVGGAVGNAVYQLARARGAAFVAGTAGSKAKADLALSAGFTHVIDLSSESVQEGVARLNGDRGVDIVVDSVGGNVTGAALSTLADDGTLVALGYVAGPRAEINLPEMVRKRARIQAVSLARMPAEIIRGLYEAMRDEFARGLIRPFVARSFPLEEAAQAQRHLDLDRPFGKVLLRVAD
jgi:NADPH:quinone reductase-like Zn-dependent oxidoreductase